MSEMIERVARALCKALQIEGEDGYEATDWNSNQSEYREMAVAAINAMREPTQAMIDASPIWNDDARRYHAIMIDAALGTNP